MNEAKKAAKKVPVKQANPEQDHSKDVRRAYEHLGRVEALHSHVDPASGKKIATLSELAEQQLSHGNSKGAADLLRAAEHVSFGALSGAKHHEPLEPKLEEAIEEEFHHKLDKADERWKKLEQPEPAVANLYKGICEQAQKAFDERAFRRALEYARGAEAIAHVKVAGTNEVSEGSRSLALQS